MDRLLSNSDIARALGGRCLVIEYKQLQDLPSDIMEIMRIAHGRLVLLYEAEPYLGHWVSVVQGAGPQAGRIFYTDPYGAGIDAPLDAMAHRWRAASGQDVSRLAHLLGAAPDGVEIWYNERPLQSDGAGVATCGRWSVARCLLPTKSEKEFADLFTGVPGASPDEVVTAFTDRYL